MFRKKLSSFPFLINLVFLFFSLASCSSVVKNVVAEPKVKLATVGIKEARTDSATVVFGVEVENPNPFRLKLDSLNYQVRIGKNALSEGKLKEVASVGGGETSLVEIPISFKYSDVFASLMDLLSQGTTTYHVKGDAEFGLLKIPFEQTGKLELKK